MVEVAYWALVNNIIIGVDQNGSVLQQSIVSFIKSYPELVDEELRQAARNWQKENNRQMGIPGLAREITSGLMVQNPVTLRMDSLYSVIIDLNDTEGWSREKIADWIDTLPVQPTWKLEDTL